MKGCYWQWYWYNTFWSNNIRSNGIQIGLIYFHIIELKTKTEKNTRKWKRVNWTNANDRIFVFIATVGDGLQVPKEKYGKRINDWNKETKIMRNYNWSTTFYHKFTDPFRTTDHFMLAKGGCHHHLMIWLVKVMIFRLQVNNVNLLDA